MHSVLRAFPLTVLCFGLMGFHVSLPPSAWTKHASPSSGIPKGWDTARSHWLRMFPSVWEPHLSTAHFLRKIVFATKSSSTWAVRWVQNWYPYLAREKIAFPQQQAASSWQLQLGLWSSLSRPPACNSSSQCRQGVALKNEHFTLKQSRLHQTQDIKKEEKKSSGRVHSVLPQGLHLHTNHFKSAKLNTGLHYPHTRYISQGHSINASIEAQLNLFVCFSPCSRESIFV